MIVDDNGTLVVDDEKIADIISKYFQNIFTSSQPQEADTVIRALTPCISAETNRKLNMLPTDLEIREAMFAIHPEKASGPNGFSASFFQTN